MEVEEERPLSSLSDEETSTRNRSPGTGTGSGTGSLAGTKSKASKVTPDGATSNYSTIALYVYLVEVLNDLTEKWEVSYAGVTSLEILERDE